MRSQVNYRSPEKTSNLHFSCLIYRKFVTQVRNLFFSLAWYWDIDCKSSIIRSELGLVKSCINAKFHSQIIFLKRKSRSILLEAREYLTYLLCPWSLRLLENRFDYSSDIILHFNIIAGQCHNCFLSSCIRRVSIMN